MKISSAILFFTLTLCSSDAYAQYSTHHFTALHHLAGSWEMATKKGQLLEVWNIEDDSTMSGRSFIINNADSMLQETVLLSFRNGLVVFTSTVANQNNQQPVFFSLNKIEGDKYIFENKSHDFPQQIFYKIPGNNELQAGIAGFVNNTWRQIPFNYTRKQQ